MAGNVGKFLLLTVAPRLEVLPIRQRNAIVATKKDASNLWVGDGLVGTQVSVFAIFMLQKLKVK
jgi:hypothetical protein